MMKLKETKCVPARHEWPLLFPFSKIQFKLKIIKMISSFFSWEISLRKHHFKKEERNMFTSALFRRIKKI